MNPATDRAARAPKHTTFADFVARDFQKRLGSTDADEYLLRRWERIALGGENAKDARS